MWVIIGRRMMRLVIASIFCAMVFPALLFVDVAIGQLACWLMATTTCWAACHCAFYPMGLTA
jgi:hypothetical protein